MGLTSNAVSFAWSVALAKTAAKPKDDAIVTARLPAICPACARRDIALIADVRGRPNRWTLRCPCGYQCTYQLEAKP